MPQVMNILSRNYFLYVYYYICIFISGIKLSNIYVMQKIILVVLNTGVLHCGEISKTWALKNLGLARIQALFTVPELPVRFSYKVYLEKLEHQKTCININGPHETG